MQCSYSLDFCVCACISPQKLGALLTTLNLGLCKNDTELNSRVGAVWEMQSRMPHFSSLTSEKLWMWEKMFSVVCFCFWWRGRKLLLFALNCNGDVVVTAKNGLGFLFPTSRAKLQCGLKS